MEERDRLPTRGGGLAALRGQEESTFRLLAHFNLGIGDGEQAHVARAHVAEGKEAVGPANLMPTSLNYLPKGRILMSPLTLMSPHPLMSPRCSPLGHIWMCATIHLNHTCVRNATNEHTTRNVTNENTTRNVTNEYTT